MLGEIIAVTLILSMFLGAIWLVIAINKIFNVSLCDTCVKCFDEEECPYIGRNYIIINDCPYYEG